MPYKLEKGENCLPWEVMAWSAPRFSRSQVDAAGKSLISAAIDPLPPPSEEAEIIAQLGRDMEIVNNWRLSHSWPQFVTRKTLERRAKAINSDAVVTARLKRLPSIEAKLRNMRARHMGLTRIQDIGGCRAVMPTIREVLALAEIYEKRPLKSAQLYREPSNYIERPKPDGYRSIHLVYKYQSDSPNYRVFSGHKIEIQIRSRLQHIWATAAEMLLTFADINLRVPPGEQMHGLLSLHKDEQAKWGRFFKLMASAMALKEQQPLIAGTPTNARELANELRDLSVRLNAEHVLLGWRLAIFSSSNIHPLNGAAMYLIALDPQKPDWKISAFGEHQFEEAFNAYAVAEQTRSPSANVVLVMADSIQELRRGYPNYFGDSQRFVDELKGFINGQS